MTTATSTNEVSSSLIPDFGPLPTEYLDLANNRYELRCYRLTADKARSIGEALAFAAQFDSPEVFCAYLDIKDDEGYITFEIKGNTRPQTISLRYMADRWSAVDSIGATSSRKNVAETPIKNRGITTIFHAFLDRPLRERVFGELGVSLDAQAKLVTRINFKEKTFAFIAAGDDVKHLPLLESYNTTIIPKTPKEDSETMSATEDKIENTADQADSAQPASLAQPAREEVEGYPPLNVDESAEKKEEEAIEEEAAQEPRVEAQSGEAQTAVGTEAGETGAVLETPAVESPAAAETEAPAETPKAVQTPPVTEEIEGYPPLQESAKSEEPKAEEEPTVKRKEAPSGKDETPAPEVEPRAEAAAKKDHKEKKVSREQRNATQEKKHAQNVEPVSTSQSAARTSYDNSSRGTAKYDTYSQSEVDNLIRRSAENVTSSIANKVNAQQKQVKDSLKDQEYAINQALKKLTEQTEKANSKLDATIAELSTASGKQMDNFKSSLARELEEFKSHINKQVLPGIKLVDARLEQLAEAKKQSQSIAGISPGVLSGIVVAVVILVIVNFGVSYYAFERISNLEKGQQTDAGKQSTTSDVPIPDLMKDQIQKEENSAAPTPVQ